MAQSVEIGSGYLSLVASAKGIKQQIIGELSGDMAAAGQQSGNTLADNTHEAAGGKFSKMGAILGGLLVTGIGLAAAGIGSAIASAMDSQDARAKMTAQLGLSPEETKRLGGVAGKVYAGAYGESLGEVNTAIVKITQDIGKGSDEWTKKTTEDVLSVAQAFDEDLGGVTKAVGNLMKNGLAKDATEALDIITVGMQNGSNKADDLLDTFNEYSTMFRDLGISGTKAMGLISQGLKAGARDADTVADALKEFAIRAQDGTDASAAGFKAIGLSGKEMTAVFAKGGPEASAALDDVLKRLREMEDPVARNAAAVALFGTKAEDLGDALYALDGSTAVDALGKVEGAAGKVNEALGDTASAKIESWKRTIEQNVVGFVTDTVVPFFQNLAARINLTDLVKQLQGRIAEFKAYIQIVISDVRRWVAEHQNDLAALKITAEDTLDSLKTHIGDVTAAIKFIWDNFGENIFTFLIEKLQGLLEMVSGIMTGLKGIFQTVFGFITFDTDMMMEGLKNIFKGGLEFLEGLIDSTLGSIVNLFGGNWQAVKDRTSEAWDKIKSFVGDGVQGIVNHLRFIAEIPDRVRAWWYGILVSIAVVTAEILDFVGDIPHRILSQFGAPGELLYNVGKDMLRGLMNGMKAMVGELVSTAQNVALAPLNAAKAVLGINSPSKEFEKVGLGIGEGLVKGIVGSTASVVTAANDLALATMTGSSASFDLGLSTNEGMMSIAGGAGTVVINVYGSDGQSIESLATAVANKQRNLGRL